MNTENILDSAVKDIVTNPGYLTEQNIRDLSSIMKNFVIPSENDEVPQTKDLTNKDLSISVVLQKSITMLDRMYQQALTSTDFAEKKSILTALKQMSDTLIKHSEKAEAQDRTIHLENAMVEAVEEVSLEENVPSLKEKFLKKLKYKLS